jgi:hypothetical protein
MEYMLIAFYIFVLIIVNIAVALMIDSLLEMSLGRSYKRKYRRYLLIPGIPFIVLILFIPVALFKFMQFVVLDFFED